MINFDNLCIKERMNISKKENIGLMVKNVN